MEKIDNYAFSPTLSLSSNWYNLNVDELAVKAVQIIEKFNDNCIHKLRFRSLSRDGNLLVAFITTPPASVRGSLLLDLEIDIKANLDIGVVVWHESLGDKNSLRKFRGIEVKNGIID
jgi:hypothetical protein